MIAQRRRLSAQRWLATSLGRRTTLSGIIGLITLLGSKPGLTLGRIPSGGKLRVSVPWSTRRLDPHDANDPLGALFASAVAEPLFAKDRHGRVYPALAEGMPQQVARGSVVTLRAGLQSAWGKPLLARDLVWSWERAMRHAPRALLQDFGTPRLMPDSPRRVLFTNSNSQALAGALSSPLTALLPKSFSPDARPDGCGAFRARISGQRLTLTRNEHAARGPAFLDSIEVVQADDLSDPLRRFESGELDLGWLGRGLHRIRKGSVLEDCGAVAWVTLHTGAQLGGFGAPGTAATLLRALPAEQLQRFGLKPVGSGRLGVPYQGPAAELLVPNNSAYLLELGRTMAGLLSRPGSPITVKSLPRRDLMRAQRSRAFGFLLNLVRPLGTDLKMQQISLLHEANPKLSRKVPQLSARNIDQLVEQTTRTLSMGVVGSLHVIVAHMGDFRNLAQWHLAEVWRPQ